ncbi:MAG: LOG family protein [Candidatus Kerfeldbacteria bacterium]|nr:LOG family protein [Candidatus Kerfeldbacteria bacterium]
MALQIGTVPGTVIHEGGVENKAGLVFVKEGVAKGEVEFKTDGLVVSISGGSTLPQGHPVCYEAEKLALGIVNKGGVLVNGGENSGTMLAVTSVAQDYTLGIHCPYHEAIPFGAKTVVNSYQTRKMLISIMPIVAVFPGQVGTLDELMTCIGWIKSLFKQNGVPPRLFVHTYWWDVIELIYKKGAIQPNVWEHIKQFNEVDEIIKSL